MNMSAFHTLIFFIMQMAAVFTLPSVQKCKLSDSACLKTTAQAFLPSLVAGIPELNTEVLDVMHVDNIKVDLAGLNLDMSNIDILGLKDTVIDKLSVNMAKKKIELVYHMDIVLKGRYKASGRLLVLPISGDGDVNIKLKHLDIVTTIPFEVKTNENGKDIIEPKSFKYKYDVKDHAHYHLSNLFNGNKLLSDAMLKFMNENWKLLSQEFGKPLLEKPQEKIFKAIKGYLSSQPLEDIAEI